MFSHLRFFGAQVLYAGTKRVRLQTPKGKTSHPDGKYGQVLIWSYENTGPLPSPSEYKGVVLGCNYLLSIPPSFLWL